MKKNIQSRVQSCNSVYDHAGTEVFEPEEIVEAYKKEFDNRLTGTDIKPILQDYKTKTEEVCMEIIAQARTRKTENFSPEEYDRVIDKLQRGKAHGPDRKPAEIFKYGGKSFDL